LRYQDEIYPYLNSNFSPRRVFEIDIEIFEKVGSLQYLPQRGSRERTLTDLSQEARFVLYRASDKFELKILFYIDESAQTVYVTDFFPTKMNPVRMKFS
jgi:hypothetical protein